MSAAQTQLKVVTVKCSHGSKSWQGLTDSVLFCIAKDTLPIHTV